MSVPHNRVISLAGRSFHTSATMGDIFLAHVSDIVERGETALVPLVHEGGVEQLFVGPMSVILVTDLSRSEVATSEATDADAADTAKDAHVAGAQAAVANISPAIDHRVTSAA